MSGAPLGVSRVELIWGAAVSALLLLVNIGYVASSLGLVHKPRHVLETDHYRYIEMARSPAGEQPLARTAPFCWRVLAPWLARGLTRLGLGINPAFYLLTNASLFAFLMTLFLQLRGAGRGLGTSLLGVAFVGLLQGAVRWYEYQYWMTDPLCLFLIVLSLRLIERGRDAGLAVVSVLGVLTRESYLLVLPYVLLRRLRERGTSGGFARALGVSVLSLAALLLVRHSVVPVNDSDALRTMERALAFRWRHLLDNQLYLLSFGSFGVLFPLVLLLPGRLRAWSRARFEEPAFVASVFVSLTLGNNTERLLAYALPVVVPLGLAQLEAFAERARLPLTALAGVCLGLQLLVWSQTRLLGEQGLSAYQPANAWVAGALTLFWLGCRWRLLRVASRESASGTA